MYRYLNNLFFMAIFRVKIHVSDQIWEGCSWSSLLFFLAHYATYFFFFIWYPLTPILYIDCETIALMVLLTLLFYHCHKKMKHYEQQFCSYPPNIHCHNSIKKCGWQWSGGRNDQIGQMYGSSHVFINISAFNFLILSQNLENDNHGKLFHIMKFWKRDGFIKWP